VRKEKQGESLVFLFGEDMFV